MIFRALVLACVVASAAAQCPPLPDPTVGCNICGATTGTCVTAPDAIFSFTGFPDVACGDLQNAGFTGSIPLDQCVFLPGFITACACGVPDGTTAPVTSAPIAPPPVTIAPVAAPTDAPVTPVPTPAPVVPTSAPTPAPIVGTRAPVVPTPAPVTPAPVTPAPVAPTAAPVTPAPVTPKPTTPAPVTAAPTTAAPVAPVMPTPYPIFVITPEPTPTVEFPQPVAPTGKMMGMGKTKKDKGKMGKRRVLSDILGSVRGAV